LGEHRGRAGEVATERDVKYEVLSGEEFVDRAATGRPVANWGAERRSIDRAGARGYRRRDLRAWEEPNGDAAFRELGHPHAPAITGESSTVRGVGRVGDDAAFVACGQVRAVGRIDQRRALHGRDLSATRVGVEAHLLVRHLYQDQ